MSNFNASSTPSTKSKKTWELIDTNGGKNNKTIFLLDRKVAVELPKSHAELQSLFTVIVRDKAFSSLLGEEGNSIEFIQSDQLQAGDAYCLFTNSKGESHRKTISAIKREQLPLAGTPGKLYNFSIEHFRKIEGEEDFFIKLFSEICTLLASPFIFFYELFAKPDLTVKKQANAIVNLDDSGNNQKPVTYAGFLEHLGFTTEILEESFDLSDNTPQTAKVKNALKVLKNSKKCGEWIDAAARSKTSTEKRDRLDNLCQLLCDKVTKRETFLIPLRLHEHPLIPPSLLLFLYDEKNKHYIVHRITYFPKDVKLANENHKDIQSWIIADSFSTRESTHKFLADLFNIHTPFKVEKERAQDGVEGRDPILDMLVRYKAIPYITPHQQGANSQSRDPLEVIFSAMNVMGGEIDIFSTRAKFFHAFFQKLIHFIDANRLSLSAEERLHVLEGLQFYCKSTTKYLEKELGPAYAAQIIGDVNLYLEQRLFDHKNAKILEVDQREAFNQRMQPALPSAQLEGPIAPPAQVTLLTGSKNLNVTTAIRSKSQEALEQVKRAFDISLLKSDQKIEDALAILTACCAEHAVQDNFLISNAITVLKGFYPNSPGLISHLTAAEVALISNNKVAALEALKNIKNYIEGDCVVLEALQEVVKEADLFLAQKTSQGGPDKARVLLHGLLKLFPIEDENRTFWERIPLSNIDAFSKVIGEITDKFFDAVVRSDRTHLSDKQMFAMTPQEKFEFCVTLRLITQKLALRKLVGAKSRFNDAFVEKIRALDCQSVPFQAFSQTMGQQILEEMIAQFTKKLTAARSREMRELSSKIRAIDEVIGACKRKQGDLENECNALILKVRQNKKCTNADFGYRTTASSRICQQRTKFYAIFAHCSFIQRLSAQEKVAFNRMLDQLDQSPEGEILKFLQRNNFVQDGRILSAPVILDMLRDYDNSSLRYQGLFKEQGSAVMQLFSFLRNLTTSDRGRYLIVVRNPSFLDAERNSLIGELTQDYQKQRDDVETQIVEEEKKKLPLLTRYNFLLAQDIQRDIITPLRPFLVHRLQNFSNGNMVGNLKDQAIQASQNQNRFRIKPPTVRDLKNLVEACFRWIDISQISPHLGGLSYADFLERLPKDYGLPEFERTMSAMQTEVYHFYLGRVLHNIEMPANTLGEYLDVVNFHDYLNGSLDIAEMQNPGPANFTSQRNTIRKEDYLLTPDKTITFEMELQKRLEGAHHFYDEFLRISIDTDPSIIFAYSFEYDDIYTLLDRGLLARHRAMRHSQALIKGYSIHNQGMGFHMDPATIGTSFGDAQLESARTLALDHQRYATGCVDLAEYSPRAAPGVAVPTQAAAPLVSQQRVLMTRHEMMRQFLLHPEKLVSRYKKDFDPMVPNPGANASRPDPKKAREVKKTVLPSFTSASRVALTAHNNFIRLKAPMVNVAPHLLQSLQSNYVHGCYSSGFAFTTSDDKGVQSANFVMEKEYYLNQVVACSARTEAAPGVWSDIQGYSVDYLGKRGEPSLDKVGYLDEEASKTAECWEQEGATVQKLADSLLAIAGNKNELANDTVLQILHFLQSLENRTYLSDESYVFDRLYDLLYQGNVLSQFLNANSHLLPEYLEIFKEVLFDLDARPEQNAQAMLFAHLFFDSVRSWIDTNLEESADPELYQIVQRKIKEITTKNRLEDAWDTFDNISNTTKQKIGGYLYLMVWSRLDDQHQVPMDAFTAQNLIKARFLIKESKIGGSHLALDAIVDQIWGQKILSKIERDVLGITTDDPRVKKFKPGTTEQESTVLDWIRTPRREMLKWEKMPNLGPYVYQAVHDNKTLTINLQTLTGDQLDGLYLLLKGATSGELPTIIRRNPVFKKVFGEEFDPQVDVLPTTGGWDKYRWKDVEKNIEYTLLYHNKNDKVQILQKLPSGESYIYSERQVKIPHIVENVVNAFLKDKQDASQLDHLINEKGMWVEVTNDQTKLKKNGRVLVALTGQDLQNDPLILDVSTRELGTTFAGISIRDEKYIITKITAAYVGEGKERRRLFSPNAIKNPLLCRDQPGMLFLGNKSGKIEEIRIPSVRDYNRIYKKNRYNNQENSGSVPVDEAGLVLVRSTTNSNEWFVKGQKEWKYQIESNLEIETLFGKNWREYVLALVNTDTKQHKYIVFPYFASPNLKAPGQVLIVRDIKKLVESIGAQAVVDCCKPIIEFLIKEHPEAKKFFHGVLPIDINPQTVEIVLGKLTEYFSTPTLVEYGTIAFEHIDQLIEKAKPGSINRETFEEIKKTITIPIEEFLYSFVPNSFTFTESSDGNSSSHFGFFYLAHLQAMRGNYREAGQYLDQMMERGVMTDHAVQEFQNKFMMFMFQSTTVSLAQNLNVATLMERIKRLGPNFDPQKDSSRLTPILDSIFSTLSPPSSSKANAFYLKRILYLLRISERLSLSKQVHIFGGHPSVAQLMTQIFRVYATMLYAQYHRSLKTDRTMLEDDNLLLSEEDEQLVKLLYKFVHSAACMVKSGIKSDAAQNLNPEKKLERTKTIIREIGTRKTEAERELERRREELPRMRRGQNVKALKKLEESIASLESEIPDLEKRKAALELEVRRLEIQVERSNNHFDPEMLDWIFENKTVKKFLSEDNNVFENLENVYKKEINTSFQAKPQDPRGIPTQEDIDQMIVVADYFRGDPSLKSVAQIHGKLGQQPDAKLLAYLPRYIDWVLNEVQDESELSFLMMPLNISNDPLDHQLETGQDPDFPLVSALQKVYFNSRKVSHSYHVNTARSLLIYLFRMKQEFSKASADKAKKDHLKAWRRGIKNIFSRLEKDDCSKLYKLQMEKSFDRPAIGTAMDYIYKKWVDNYSLLSLEPNKEGQLSVYRQALEDFFQNFRTTLANTPEAHEKPLLQLQPINGLPPQAQPAPRPVVADVSVTLEDFHDIISNLIEIAIDHGDEEIFDTMIASTLEEGEEKSTGKEIIGYILKALSAFLGKKDKALWLLKSSPIQKAIRKLAKLVFKRYEAERNLCTTDTEKRGIKFGVLAAKGITECVKGTKKTPEVFKEILLHFEREFNEINAPEMTKFLHEIADNPKILVQFIEGFSSLFADLSSAIDVQPTNQSAGGNGLLGRLGHRLVANSGLGGVLEDLQSMKENSAGGSLNTFRAMQYCRSFIIKQFAIKERAAPQQVRLKEKEKYRKISSIAVPITESYQLDREFYESCFADSANTNKYTTRYTQCERLMEGYARSDDPKVKFKEAGILAGLQEKRDELTNRSKKSSLKFGDRKELRSKMEEIFNLRDQRARELSKQLYSLASSYRRALKLSHLFSPASVKNDQEVLYALFNIYQDGGLFCIKNVRDRAMFEEMITEYLFVKTEMQQLKEASFILDKMEVIANNVIKKKQADGTFKASEIQNYLNNDEDSEWCLKGLELKNALLRGSDRYRFCRYNYQDGFLPIMEEPDFARRYLVKEYQSGWISRQKAIEALDLLLKDFKSSVIRKENPVRFAKVRMGVGKTSFIFPKAAEICTSNGKDVVVMTVANLVDQLHSELGNKAIRFDFDSTFGIAGLREGEKPDPQVVERHLKNILRNLESLKDNNNFIVTTPTARAALRNKIVELQDQLEKIDLVAAAARKKEDPKLKQRGLLSVQLQRLLKIEAFFKKESTVTFEDEDNVQDVSFEYNKATTKGARTVNPVLYHSAQKIVQEMFACPQLAKEIFGNSLMRIPLTTDDSPDQIYQEVAALFAPSVTPEVVGKVIRKSILHTQAYIVIKILRDKQYWLRISGGGTLTYQGAGFKEEEWQKWQGPNEKRIFKYIFSAEKTSHQNQTAEEQIESLEQAIFITNLFPKEGINDSNPDHEKFQFLDSLKLLMGPNKPFSTIYKVNTKLARGLCRKNGLLNVPYQDGIEKRNTQDGNEYETIFHHLFAYGIGGNNFTSEKIFKTQLKIFADDNDTSIALASDTLESFRTGNPSLMALRESLKIHPAKNWKEWLSNINKVKERYGLRSEFDAFSGKLPIGHKYTPEEVQQLLSILSLERMQYLNWAMFESKKIFIFPEQYTCNSQAIPNRDIRVASGTGDVFDLNLANIGDQSQNVDDVISETLLLGNPEEAATVFQDPEEHIRECVRNRKFVSVVNLDYEILGGNATALIAKLRAMPEAKNLQFHWRVRREQPNGTPTFERFSWDPGKNTQPRPYSHDRVNEKDSFFYYGPCDSRGVDFRVPRKNQYASIMAGLSTYIDMVNQGAGRMRQLGFGQNYSFAIDQKMRDRVITQNHLTPDSHLRTWEVMRSIWRNTLIMKEFIHVKAATFRIKNIAGDRIDRVCKTPWIMDELDYQVCMQEDSLPSAQNRYVDVLNEMERAIFQTHRDNFCRKNDIKWSQNFHAQKEYDSIEYLRLQCEQEKEKVERKEKEFYRRIACYLRLDKNAMDLPLAGLKDQSPLKPTEQAQLFDEIIDLNNHNALHAMHKSLMKRENFVVLYNQFTGTLEQRWVQIKRALINTQPNDPLLQKLLDDAARAEEMTPFDQYLVDAFLVKNKKLSVYLESLKFLTPEGFEKEWNRMQELMRKHSFIEILKQKDKTQLGVQSFAGIFGDKLLLNFWYKIYKTQEASRQNYYEHLVEMMLFGSKEAKTTLEAELRNMSQERRNLVIADLLETVSGKSIAEYLNSWKINPRGNHPSIATQIEAVKKHYPSYFTHVMANGFEGDVEQQVEQEQEQEQEQAQEQEQNQDISIVRQNRMTDPIDMNAFYFDDRSATIHMNDFIPPGLFTNASFGVSARTRNFHRTAGTRNLDVPYLLIHQSQRGKTKGVLVAPTDVPSVSAYLETHNNRVTNGYMKMYPLYGALQEKRGDKFDLPRVFKGTKFSYTHRNQDEDAQIMQMLTLSKLYLGINLKDYTCGEITTVINLCLRMKELTQVELENKQVELQAARARKQTFRIAQLQHEIDDLQTQLTEGNFTAFKSFLSTDDDSLRVYKQSGGSKPQQFASTSMLTDISTLWMKLDRVQKPTQEEFTKMEESTNERLLGLVLDQRLQLRESAGAHFCDLNFVEQCRILYYYINNDEQSLKGLRIIQEVKEKLDECIELQNLKHRWNTCSRKDRTTRLFEILEELNGSTRTGSPLKAPVPPLLDSLSFTKTLSRSRRK